MSRLCTERKVSSKSGEAPASGCGFGTPQLFLNSEIIRFTDSSVIDLLCECSISRKLHHSNILGGALTRIQNLWYWSIFLSVAKAGMTSEEDRSVFVLWLQAEGAQGSANIVAYKLPERAKEAISSKANRERPVAPEIADLWRASLLSTCSVLTRGKFTGAWYLS